MNKLSLFLLSICSLHLLNGCGSGSTTPVATHFSVTSASATPTAGTPFNITVTALDKSGQMVTTYADTVQFTSSNGKAVQPGSGTLASGMGTFSVTLNTAGSQTITATDAASLTGTSNSLMVSIATSHFSVAVPSNATTGIAFNITVFALDVTNKVVTGYSGIMHFTSTDGQATLPVDSTLANGAGTFSATLKTLGNQTITATDSASASVTGVSSAISVASTAATHFSLSGPLFGDASPGSLLRLGVTALDAANNTASGYSGTIHFTSTDPLASLPANSTLTNGTGNFSATLNTVGSQTITATDTVSPSITGISNFKIAKLMITSGTPPSGSVGVAYGSTPQCYAGPGFALGASGGNPGFHGGGYVWSSTSLPPGLYIGQLNYVVDTFMNSCPPGGFPAPFILGTPTQAGTFNNVVITIHDQESPAATASATYTIMIGAPPPTVNTTPPPPPSVVNQPYTFTFTGSGYGALTLSESGALPAGLSFDNNTATLSGTPTQTGSFPITVTATDQFKQNSAPADFTIVVSPHGFFVTGSMKAARLLHTATLLTGGKVLIAGGQLDANHLLATAELYDPITGSFTATGNLQASRSEHTATLLNDGRVLLAGGVTGTALANPVATAELYDPTGATSSATGSMLTGRYNHTATLLNNGQVLVAGGRGADGAALGSAELFNPATGVFSSTGAMNSARSGHTATLLANGMVLVAGGANSKGLDTAEIYDPTAKTFTTVAGIMTEARVSHTVTLFLTGPDSGKVLLAGGGDDASVNASNTAELFDPTAKSFTATTNMVSAHAGHTAALLSGGTVLLAGGMDSSGAATAVVELFDPTSGNFSATGSLVAARESQTSTLLNDGRVLVTGGDNSSGALSSAELYK